MSTTDPAAIPLSMLVIFVSAKVLAELFERLHQPAPDWTVRDPCDRESLRCARRAAAAQRSEMENKKSIAVLRSSEAFRILRCAPAFHAAQRTQ